MRTFISACVFLFGGVLAGCAPIQNNTTPLEFDTTPVSLSGKTYIITERTDVLPPFDATNSITRAASGGTPPYTYASSNPDVAVVSGSGMVTPRANGSASISVTDRNGHTKAFDITFAHIIQVRDHGSHNFVDSRSLVVRLGERLPSFSELKDLQNAYVGRWPYSPGKYWIEGDICYIPGVMDDPRAGPVNALGGAACTNEREIHGAVGLK